MPVNARAAGVAAKVLSRAHSSALSGMRAKKAETCGSIALCASRKAGESATDWRCVTFPQACESSSVACSSARKVVSYVSAARSREAIASIAACARSRAVPMAGAISSGVSRDQRM